MFRLQRLTQQSMGSLTSYYSAQAGASSPLFFRKSAAHTSSVDAHVLQTIQHYMKNCFYHRAKPLLQGLIAAEKDNNIKKCQKMAKIHFWYAEVLSNGTVEEYMLAKHAFDTAIKLDPNNNDIRKAIEGYELSLIPGIEGRFLTRPRGKP